MQLGDYVRLILLCAVVLPLIAGFLLSRNSMWSVRLGRVVGGLGLVAGAMIALLVLFVIIMCAWLAYQMSNP